MKSQHSWITSKYLQAFFELSLKHYGNPVYFSPAIFLLQLLESLLISAALVLNSRSVVWKDNVRQVGYFLGLVYDVG